MGQRKWLSNPVGMFFTAGVECLGPHYLPSTASFSSSPKYSHSTFFIWKELLGSRIWIRIRWAQLKSLMTPLSHFPARYEKIISHVCHLAGWFVVDLHRIAYFCLFPDPKVLLLFGTTLLCFTHTLRSGPWGRVEGTSAQKWTKWQRDGRASNRKYNMKQVITVGNWNVILWETSGNSVKHLPKLSPRGWRELVYLYTGSHHALVRDAPWAGSGYSCPECTVLWLWDVDTGVRGMLEHNEVATLKIMGTGVQLNV